MRIEEAILSAKEYLAKCELDYADGDGPSMPVEAVRALLENFRTVHALQIIKAMTWGADRLNACDRTIRDSRKESRDWAYGESIAIKAMLAILVGKDVPR